MCREEEGHEDGGGRQGLGGSPGHCLQLWNLPGAHDPYHVVAGQQLLQELCLLVHHGLDDELVIAGDVEEGAAGAGVGELNQWLIAQRVLEGGGEWVGQVPSVMSSQETATSALPAGSPPPSHVEGKEAPTYSQQGTESHQ